MNQVKVTQIETLNTSQGDVLVKKGKLVLILNPNIFPEINQIGQYFNEKELFLNRFSPSVRKQGIEFDCGAIIPIIISETEKIETGDKIWSKGNNQIYYVKAISNGKCICYQDGKYVGDYVVNNFNIYKIIALPEYFSSKHLQAIVDGKLKDEDEVYVEVWLDDTKLKEDLSNYPKDASIIIKLNSNNHIILHKSKHHKILLTNSQIELLKSGNVKHNKDGSIEYQYPFVVLEKNGEFYITIHKINQKTYTRQEVENIIKSFADDCEMDDDLIRYYGRDQKGNKNWKGTSLEKWIRNNL